MQLSRTDLADFSYFLAIARHRNFRRAGLELGVSASALSHSLKGLEARLGVRLLNRTSRSVTLTAAGEELRAAIAAHFEAIGSAADVLNRHRDDPAGRIRLNVLEHAATVLLAPALPSFISRYPDIEVDVIVSNDMIDVVEAGADAGIRYGGTVPEDMVAQRLSPDMRWVATSAPIYFERSGTPMHPNDLARGRDDPSFDAGLRARNAQAHSLSATGGKRAGRIAIGTHFREMFAAFGNRAFLAIFGFGVFKFTAIGLYAATALYFNTYLFRLTSPQLALLALDSVVAACIAAPLAPVMSHRLGKRTSSMMFAILGVALGLSPLVLAYFDLFFVPGDPRMLPTLFVIGAVYGAMVAISLINTSSMLADVVEDSAVRTGRYEAGTFFAAASLMQQCSTALGLAANGVILTWASFPAKVTMNEVNEAMLDSLILHYVPVSFGLRAIGCAMLVFYPITKARHQSNVEALQARQTGSCANDQSLS